MQLEIEEAGYKNDCVCDRFQLDERSVGLTSAARLVFRAPYKTNLCPNLLHGCTAEGAGVGARCTGAGAGGLRRAAGASS